MSVRITVSGIRGRVPEGLDVLKTSEFAGAFSEFLGKGKKVFISTDGRATGEMLKKASISSFIASGIDVVDLGICPTPVVQKFLKEKREIHGGFVITGGHNPEEWNALLLVGEDGSHLDYFNSEEVFNIYHSKRFNRVSWNELGKYSEEKGFFDRYVDYLVEFVNSSAIRKSNFKIVFDCSNGASGELLKLISDAFDIKATIINSTTGKKFSHPPEPNIENSEQVSTIVKAIGADVGFVLNSDSSRVSIVDETGRALSEEYTLPLVYYSFVRVSPSPIITTVSTSRMVDFIAEKFGRTVLRVKVGQSHVVNSSKAYGIEIGGEGSGSVFLSKFSYGYDSFLSILKILELVSKENKTISQLSTVIPDYFILKRKYEMPISKLYSTLHCISKEYEDDISSTIDGIRVDKKDFWFNIRVSTTEFALRVIIEAENEKKAYSVFEELDEKIRRLI